MNIFKTTVAIAALALSVSSVHASCKDIPRSALDSALKVAEAAGKATGGYGLPMWLSFVDESGKVCEVLTSGTPGALAGNTEWLGSRVISAQKANTANAFSLNGYAISTANLYSAVQPGGSLYGLQASNPVDTKVAYAGNEKFFGTALDPLRGKRIGGVNVFGGGLAVYLNGHKVGAIGVSGDTSCRDHAYAWRVRAALNAQPGGVGITTTNIDAYGNAVNPLPGAKVGDEAILQGSGDSYWNAWSQPVCPGSLNVVNDPANGTLVGSSSN